MKLVVGWSGAALLTVYGSVQLTSQALVAVGVIHVPDDFDSWAFTWHLFLWSPSSCFGALLLGLAVWRFQRGSGSSPPP